VRKKFITEWAYKEGIFKTPHGKFIARIKVGNRYETISMHPTYEEAEKVYLLALLYQLSIIKNK